MEFDSGFSFTSSDGLLKGLAPDPKADAEKILEEARQQDIKTVDEDDTKVKVDSAFRMEGGGCVDVCLILHFYSSVFPFELP